MGIQVMENLVSKSSPGAYTATGRSAAIASNRLSYVHGLEGPSMSVDTACSSALVALDVACHSLQTRALLYVFHTYILFYLIRVYMYIDEYKHVM